MKKDRAATESRKQNTPKSDLWSLFKEALLGRKRQFDCLQVEVSSRCFGRCSYCPHTTMAKQWRGRDMDMDTFSRLLPLMRRSVRVHLQGWGEPFLNPAFFTMAAMAKKAGCNVSTTTCGLGMDSSRAADIAKSGIDIIAFSLVGTDPASNAQRHGVDFDQVCQGIETLLEMRQRSKGDYPEVHLAYLLLASNSEAVAGLPALMQRLGVGHAVISTLDYLPEPGLKDETFPPEESEKIKKMASLLQETAVEADSLNLKLYYQFPRPVACENGCLENIGKSLFVAADGGISPCIFVNVPAAMADVNRRVFGNIHDKDPLKIWESPEYLLFRNRLAGGNPDPPCSICPKRYQLQR